MQLSPAKSADQEWEELKDLGKPKSSVLSSNLDAASLEKGRKDFIADLLRDADKLKHFQSKHPGHVGSKEAKRLEGLVLVRAWQAGDSTRDSRREQLVAELRKDASFSEAQRAEVAALADHVAVEKRPGLSRVAKQRAYEEVLRGLNAEFPSMPDGYEAMVHLARDSSPDRALVLAGEVVASKYAPTWTKTEAQIIFDRHALIGQPLLERTKNVWRTNNPIEEAAGRPIIVYSWASFDPGSIALAKDIMRWMPQNALVIGVCLDFRDTAPAKALAQRENLPGEQVYDWLGRKGELAQELHLTDTALAYVADRQGVIRSVTGPEDLPAILNSL